MNIGVVGCGYVGLTNASVWARKYSVGLWDSDNDKILEIKQGKIPFKDEHLEKGFGKLCDNFILYNTFEEFVASSSVFLLAIPTDISTDQSKLNTDDLEYIIKEIICRKIIGTETDCTIVIKSTIPVGFVDEIRLRYDFANIVYVPEFLREGMAYYDCINPQRIVVGDTSQKIKTLIEEYIDIIGEIESVNPVKVLYVTAKEAECIKLFSNAYLAMRVAFFNEVDSLAEIEELNTEHIISGICSDARIGDFYNNPSFGYGGYCLPKDTKALAAYSDSLGLIKAIVDSNESRKERIADRIKKMNRRIGIYKLNMKYNSDNTRGSALVDVVEILVKDNISVVICASEKKEELINEKIQIVSSLEELNEKCDIIVTNRMYPELEKYIEKVYTRDLFSRD